MTPLEQHLPYALRQFATEILVPIEVLGVNLSFTTGSWAKVATVIALCVYLWFAVRERAIVPNRIQSSAEWLYELVESTVVRIAGPQGRASIPFVFTVFVFVWFGTLLGLTPIKDTFTTQLATTFALALSVFVYVNALALQRQGVGFFRHFLPAGTPVFVAPVLVTVELVSYLFRPVTMGFRLFANIVAGHIMLKLFADFCTMLVGALGSLGLLAAVAPLALMAVLWGFEILIVCIQAYIFMLITAMYLRDAVRAH